jgi:hypothetical protein
MLQINSHPHPTSKNKLSSSNIKENLSINQKKKKLEKKVIQICITEHQRINSKSKSLYTCNGFIAISIIEPNEIHRVGSVGTELQFNRIGSRKMTLFEPNYVTSFPFLLFVKISERYKKKTANTIKIEWMTDVKD